MLELTLLHLGDEVLVEETKGLLVERAVDGDNIALSEHLLETLDTTAANLLLDLRRERLVVVVEELLAVEWLQAAQDTLANATDGDSSNNLALKVILVLSDSSDIPVAVTDLVVGGNEVADQGQDGHDDVLSDGDDIATSDLGDGDTAVGLVGSIQVDVVRADTSSDGELQVLGLGQTFGGQIAGVEGSRNDDLSVNKLLLEGGVRTLLVGGGNEGVALVLEPLAQAELVLDSSQKTGLLLGVLTALKLVVRHRNKNKEQGHSSGGIMILTSYRHIRTLPCSFAEAVNVRALKGEGVQEAAQERAQGPLAESREEAGRRSWLERERENTILKSESQLKHNDNCDNARSRMTGSSGSL